jgi:DNA helicase II / ATP-dependent DNA helicase PcrA
MAERVGHLRRAAASANEDVGHHLPQDRACASCAGSCRGSATAAASRSTTRRTAAADRPARQGPRRRRQAAPPRDPERDQPRQGRAGRLRDLRQRAGGWPEIQIADVYEAYEDRLRRPTRSTSTTSSSRPSRCCSCSTGARALPAALRHLMVDEYQDTNRAQYHLVNSDRRPPQRHGRRRPPAGRLRLPRRDDPQHPRLRERPPRRPGHRPRSQLPLDADDPRRRQRGHPVGARRTPCGAVDRPRLGAPVVRYRADDEHDEAAFVAEEVEKLVAGTEDVRPLRRRRGLLPDQRPVPRARGRLLRVGLPYKVVGGVRFYERKEIKDVLAYLRLLVNPADDVSRASRHQHPTPRHRRPHRRGARLARPREGISFLGGGREAEVVQGLGPAPSAPSRVRRSCSTGCAPSSSTTCRSRPARVDLDRTGYLRELEAERTIEALGRVENLRGARVGRERVPRAGWPAVGSGGPGGVPRVGHAGQ